MHEGIEENKNKKEKIFMNFMSFMVKKKAGEKTQENQPINRSQAKASIREAESCSLLRGPEI